MKNKIKKAITHKLSEDFDQRFWKRFNQRFPNQAPINHYSGPRKLIISSAFIMITFFLFQKQVHRLEKINHLKMDEYIQLTIEVDLITNGELFTQDDEL